MSSIYQYIELLIKSFQIALSKVWGCGAVVVAAVLLAGNTGSACAFERSAERYRLPTMPLQRADGQSMPLAQAFSDGRPVVLTFMFSSCQTVCPITNQVMVELKALLGPNQDKVNLVSVSIDPDYDSVKQMAAYARSNGHRGMYFTGDPSGSEAVQRAFSAWRGDKMHHEASFYLSRSPTTNGRWVRLSGFITPKELLHELKLVAPDLPLMQ
jgi:protein SCO1